MTGERMTATAGRVAKPGSNLAGRSRVIGGTLLAYVCAGYGVYALLWAIL